MFDDLARRSEHAPLVELARLGQLPRHQYMDAATLGWIGEHQPKFGDPAVPLPAVPADLRQIPERWFAQEKLVQSIHGLRHHARVAMHAAHLADWLGLAALERREAVLAGAIHDCRRHHDQHDPGHGARTAAWFERERREVVGLLSTESAVRAEPVAAAVELHDVPLAEFNHEQFGRYERWSAVIDVVKCADALDRYRLPKLKWWPDPHRMSLQPPAWMHQFAWRLVVETEMTALARSAEGAELLSRWEIGDGDGAL